MKRLAILGSTGSIGTRALRVVDSRPGEFRVAVLAAAGRDVDALERQVRRHRPGRVAVADVAAATALRARLSSAHPAPEILSGADAVEEAARTPGIDLVVHGVVGAAGLRPTLAAVDAGIPVALANKESLVVAGALVVARAAAAGASLIPVDSEHNAIHQCLRGERAEQVRRLWLTASGGPFRRTPADRLASVRPEDALDHPTWSMGRRITVDSATLMNKGFEVIEARWLFDVPGERIEVVVHPQSVVHSMVEFVDGSFKAQLGATDMGHAIEYALAWPERRPTALPPFDPVAAGSLTFEPPDRDRFPCLDLAFRALREGGAAPAALNAADEVAVAAFLDGRLSFPGIAEVVGRTLDDVGGGEANCLDDILVADRRAREAAARRIERGVRR